MRGMNGEEFGVLYVFNARSTMRPARRQMSRVSRVEPALQSELFFCFFVYSLVGLRTHEMHALKVLHDQRNRSFRRGVSWIRNLYD